MDLRQDPERYAVQRGRYLARTTELREPEAKAIAYAEQGYSSNGISKKIGVSESTIKDYLGRAMALYGLEIAETVLPSEELPDYHRVNSDYANQLSEEEEKKWREYVRRYSDRLPQEWVHEIMS